MKSIVAIQLNSLSDSIYHEKRVVNNIIIKYLLLTLNRDPYVPYFNQASRSLNIRPGYVFRFPNFNKRKLGN